MLGNLTQRNNQVLVQQVFLFFPFFFLYDNTVLSYY